MPSQTLTGDSFKKALVYSLKIWASTIITSPFIVEFIMYIKSLFTGSFDTEFGLIFGAAGVFLSMPSLIIAFIAIFLLNRSVNVYRTKRYLSFIMTAVGVITIALLFVAIPSEGGLIFSIPWLLVYPSVSVFFIWYYKLPVPVSLIQIPASGQ